MSELGDIHDISALTITPVSGPLAGRVSPPGSKSITNRALLLAALAPGTSHITGALKSLDTTLMSRALRQMGVEITEPDATTFVVKSSGQLQAPAEPLFLGNAGTATRFLTAAATLAEGTVVVDGDEHMRKRPIGPLVQALAAVGLDVRDTDGHPPVTVRGAGRFASGRVEIDGGLSSQYVSALLMAAPCAEGPVSVALTGPHIGARGYIELTLAAMREFGALVSAVSDREWLVEPTGYHAAEFAVEPDASAATYLWAAGALTVHAGLAGTASVAGVGGASPASLATRTDSGWATPVTAPLARSTFSAAETVREILSSALKVRAPPIPSSLRPDPQRRRLYLEEAEREALADHPVMPIYFYVSKHLISPKVQGWGDNILDYHYSQYLSISD